MKILIFTTQFYQLGGAERLAVELAEDLNRRGNHADVLSMYTEDLPGVAEAKKTLLASGIPDVKFLGLRQHPSLASLIPAVLKLRRLVRDGGYEIVETSAISTTVIAAWALRGLKARHVVGIHDIVRADRENTRQHKILRQSLRFNPRIRYYTISDRARQHWEVYVKSARGRTRRIYNAIPDKSFLTQADRKGVCEELGMPYDARILLFVGRLAVRKGVDTLLEAVEPILANGNCYLLLAGVPDLSVAGSTEMLQRVHERIAEQGLGACVKFLGFRKDIPRLLASCDLMVHPARIEAFGLVLVEAMASGAPLVATNVDGIPEILAGTDCSMVDADNAYGLRVAVLETLARLPAAAADAQRKGRERANDFRASKRTNAMIALYEDVLSGRF